VGREDLDALVDAARTRDPATWTTIYRTAYPRLYAYARRRLPTMETAEDAVSETMSRAVAGIDRYRGEGGGLIAWLHGILRNVVLDAQNVGRRFAPDATPDVIDDGADPVDLLLRDEDAARVRRAFATLSPAEQEIVELRIVSGLRAQDVGNIVGRRSGAIRMVQNRALAKLRALLEHEVHRAG
jgi:RNA polymerase sigma-70 factor (ECF subfamily)